VSSPVVYDLEGGAVGVRDLGAKLKGASTADEVRAAFSAG
jgi:hypothetical protein